MRYFSVTDGGTDKAILGVGFPTNNVFASKKRALVNRKDAFSIRNSVKYDLFRSIGGRKFNGSNKIPKLISPRTTPVYLLAIFTPPLNLRTKKAERNGTTQ